MNYSITTVKLEAVFSCDTGECKSEDLRGEDTASYLPPDVCELGEE